ncbi:MAG: hypothetical protein AAGN82_27850 [Myxococcota bacterium]
MERGRTLAGEAMRAYGDGDYPQALEQFSEAEEVYPSGQVLRMKGYTLVALERWVEAAAAIEAALESAYKPLPPDDAEDAEAQLAEVLTHVATVSLRADVDDATVRIDDASPQPLPLDVRLLAGVYRFVVQAPGYASEEAQRTLTPGETDLSFELTPLPAPSPVAAPVPPPPRPDASEADARGSGFGWFPGQGTVGLLTAGIGVALGGVALGTGLHGIDLEDAVQSNIDFHNQAYGTNCERSPDLCRASRAIINRDGERAADLRNVGLVTGIVGASLFATGAVLFLLSDDSPFAPDDDEAPNLSDDGDAVGAPSTPVSCRPSFGAAPAAAARINGGWAATGALACIGTF